MEISFYKNDCEYQAALDEMASSNDKFIRELEQRDFDEDINKLFGLEGEQCKFQEK